MGMGMGMQDGWIVSVGRRRGAGFDGRRWVRLLCGGVGDVLFLGDRFEQMCVVEIWRERGLKVRV